MSETRPKFDVDTSRPLTHGAAEVQYTALVELLTRGRPIVEADPDDPVPGRAIRGDQVAHVLVALGLKQAHLEEAVADRLEELRLARATLARDEPRLRAARDAARAAFVASEAKAPKCGHCKKPWNAAAGELKKAWNAAIAAWQSSANALQELRTYHVPRRFLDEETTVRVLAAEAAKAVLEAEAQLHRDAREVEELAGIGVVGLEEERAKEQLGGAKDALAKAKADVANLKVRASKVEAAIAASLAAALKLPAESTKRAKASA